MTASTDIATAGSLLTQLKRLQDMKSLQASDIDMLIVSARTNKFRGPQQNPSLSVAPTDPQFASVLTAANQLLNSQITALKAQIAALGVTGVP
jgi:hypothetical protein